MNADLRGMKLYYKGKSMEGIIVTDKGKKLNDREARAFIVRSPSLTSLFGMSSKNDSVSWS